MTTPFKGRETNAPSWWTWIGLGPPNSSNWFGATARSPAARSYQQPRLRRSPATATVFRSMPRARSGYVSRRGTRRAMEPSRSQCIFSRFDNLQLNQGSRSQSAVNFIHIGLGWTLARDFVDREHPAG